MGSNRNNLEGLSNNLNRDLNLNHRHSSLRLGCSARILSSSNSNQRHNIRKSLLQCLVRLRLQTRLYFPNLNTSLLSSLRLPTLPLP